MSARTARLLLVLVAAVGALPSPAGAAQGRAGGPSSPPAAALESLSPTDRRFWLDAIELTDRAPAVRRQRQLHPDLRPTGFAQEGRCCASVWYSSGGEERVVAKIDRHTGEVIEEWTGVQIAWQMARGYDGYVGRRFNAWYVCVPLGLLFLAPFVDLRRPLRLLHLDLLVLLGFGVSHVFFNRGDIDASVPLVYPVLLYLLARMLIVGFRPRPGSGPLVPHLGPRLLIAGIVVLAVARIAVNVADSHVLDIGYAGVIGADHIVEGRELYDGNFATDPNAADTYGPVNYLAYIPFRETFGWSGKWDDLPAAHAAAVFFDLLAAVALFLLGRRLAPGPYGRTLGLALVFAWMAYPYTAFALATNSNDALVAAMLIFALLAISSAPVRGVAIGLGAAAKIAPLALAPLFARGRGESELRGPLIFGAVMLAVIVAALLPFVPPGGLDDVYDRTIGFQLGRDSPFSIWGQHPGLDTLQTVAKLLAFNLAALLFVVPSRRTDRQLAALAAAVLIAFQLTVNHWFYLYVVWFAPLVLIALFSAHQPRADARLESPAQ